MSAGESVMWLVRAPGCPLRIIQAKNRDEKTPARPIQPAEVRREYERSFAKRNSEVFADRDTEWPTFEPIVESDIAKKGLQWMVEESQVTGRPRAVHIVWQGAVKANVVKGG